MATEMLHDRRRFLRTGGLATLGAALGLNFLGCGNNSNELNRPIRRIYFITIDTLRSDHLGCYGYPRETSPFLDNLVKKSIVYRKAQVPMTTTEPSHISMFTGLYPAQHQVLRNGMILNPACYTMGHDLKRRGFSTAAFVALRRFFKGLRPSFDVFDHPGKEHGFYRQAEDTLPKAMSWLKTSLNKRQKLFTWIHLFDPHDPYRPNNFLPGFNKQSKDNTDQWVEFFTLRHKTVPDFWRAYAQQIKHQAGADSLMLTCMDRYDAEVRYTDEHLRIFYDFVESQGGNQDALWIITSDHGEGLGTHGYMGHGRNIYSEQSSVPLIFHFPDGRFAPSDRKNVVETVDIWPTVAALVDGDVRRQILPVQGLPLCYEFDMPGALRPERVAMIQRRQYKSKGSATIKPGPQRYFKRYEPGQTFAAQSSRLKYIHRTAGDDELYDILGDPYEQNNLFEARQEQAKPLQHHLMTKVRQFQIHGRMGSREDNSAETIKKLRELGYIQ